jgi:hypothetical protein
MKKMCNEGNQIHNFISSSGSGTVTNYGSGSGSDFLTSYGSGYGSGSTSQKVTVPTVPVPVPVPQHCRYRYEKYIFVGLDEYFQPQGEASSPPERKSKIRSSNMIFLNFSFRTGATLTCPIWIQMRI